MVTVTQLVKNFLPLWTLKAHYCVHKNLPLGLWKLTPVIFFTFVSFAHTLKMVPYSEAEIVETVVWHITTYIIKCVAKVKVSLCLTKHHATKANWGMEL